VRSFTSQAAEEVGGGMPDGAGSACSKRAMHGVHFHLAMTREGRRSRRDAGGGIRASDAAAAHEKQAGCLRPQGGQKKWRAPGVFTSRTSGIWRAGEGAGAGTWRVRERHLAPRLLKEGGPKI